MAAKFHPRRPALTKPSHTYTLLFDPSEYPLARGMQMSKAEIDSGLVYSALLPGTRFRHGAVLYEVRSKGGAVPKLKLEMIGQEAR